MCYNEDIEVKPLALQQSEELTTNFKGGHQLMMRKIVTIVLTSIGCVMGAFCTLPVQAAGPETSTQQVLETMPILSDIVELVEATTGNYVAPPTPTPSPQDKLVLTYNQEIWLEDGIFYYESADQAGSGKHGVMNNAHIPSLRINGFARLDEFDNIANAKCFTPANVPTETEAPSFFGGHRNYTEWVCIYDAKYGNIVGWVPNAVIRTHAPASDDAGDGSNSDVEENQEGKGDVFYYKPPTEFKDPEPSKITLKCNPENMYVGTVGGGANIDD